MYVLLQPSIALADPEDGRIQGVHIPFEFSTIKIVIVSKRKRSKQETKEEGKKSCIFDFCVYTFIICINIFIFSSSFPLPSPVKSTGSAPVQCALRHLKMHLDIVHFHSMIHTFNCSINCIFEQTFIVDETTLLVFFELETLIQWSNLNSVWNKLNICTMYV